MTAGIYFLFFLSGFSALIYEVAWMRVLGLVLGNTNQAASCVLAAFLGGLAIGALIGGKLADGKNKPLLSYGCVEIGVGLVAPLVTVGLQIALDAVSSNHIFPTDNFLLTLVRLLISCALLLVPTMLMGSTLPFLVKFCVSHWSKPAHFFSRLYGINTFGAVVGSLAACFFGFAYLGISETVMVAAALSIIAGSGACLISKRVESQTPTVVAPSPETQSGQMDVTVPPDKTEPAATTQSDAVSLQTLSILGFVLGFTSLAYEVLWNRLIRASLATDTYAFTLMVSTFLSGLVLGSLIYDRWPGKSSVTPGKQLAYLGVIQFFAGVVCAISLMFMPFGRLLATTVAPVVHASFGPIIGMILTHLVVTATYMLLPATLIGMSFPMIGGLAAASAKDVGGAVGRVYGANTIGCVFGSIVAGLVLIPCIGSYAGYQMIVTITVLAGILALSRSSAKLKDKLFVPVGAVVFLAGFLVTRSPYQQMAESGSGPLVHFAEDATSSVLVLHYPESVQLIINGQPYANTILTGRRYMRMLGHLPALVHPDPKEALNICFGTGTTAGSIAMHPLVHNLDVVDLSKAVIDSAHYFTDSNYGVATKPKVHFQVADGRNFLLCSDKKYDIVSFEPPPPLEAGTVNLYSEEFYRLALRHLKAGGIMCQWVPFDQPNENVWKMMLLSARKVFNYVYVFDPNDEQAMLLGSMTPIKFSFAEMQKRISDNPDIEKALAEVGLNDAHAILATYIFSNDKIDKYVAGKDLTVTDDHPRLEYYLPYSGPALYTSRLEPFKSDPSELLTDSIPDPELLRKHQEAVKFMRLADQADQRDHDKLSASKYAKHALELFPDNRFFQYLTKGPFRPPG